MSLSSAYVYFRIAVRALRAHMFRSFLTTVSIMIGGFSIVLMSSLAGSGMATLARGIEDLGGSRLIIVGGKVPQRAERKASSYGAGITVKDRDVLFSAIPHVVGRSMYALMGRTPVSPNGASFVPIDNVASDASFFDAYQLKLAKGRSFTEEESRMQARVCVVGHKTAVRLFDGDAVGKWVVRNASSRCRVIGQLENRDRMGIHMGFDWLDVVVWPLGTIGAQTPQVLKGAQFLLKTDAPESNDSVKRIVNALLVERHHGVDDFEIFDFAGFLEKFNELFGIMRAIVGYIAGIALLVGGIGVMNMMLVSVSERVREIGIRKALGATQGAIQAQFLWEAMLLSGIGGVLGVGLGIVAVLATGPLLRMFTPGWVTVLATSATTVALIVSIAIGLLFGFFPARRAARLDAILAMRR